MAIQKSCSLRFPYYEHQTATAQREARFATRNVDHEYPSNDPNTVMQFATERWKKSKSQPPSDAIEMSMFLRENPAIQVAIDHLTPQAGTIIGKLQLRLIGLIALFCRKLFW